MGWPQVECSMQTHEDEEIHELEGHVQMHGDAQQPCPFVELKVFGQVCVNSAGQGRWTGM